MDFASIASKYDITEIVPGLHGSTRSKWGLCPIHQDRNPSFSVYWIGNRQLWKCHGSCNTGGDVIDLIGYMYVPGYNRKDITAINAAVTRLTNGMYHIAPTPPPQRVPMLPQWLWKEMLPPSERIIQYALSRGIDMGHIMQFKIGTPNAFMSREPYNIKVPGNWMSIPTFHSDELIGIKLRNISHKGIRYMAIPGSRKGLFNYNTVYGTDGTVLVTKGEIAAMVASKFGFVACAPTGGEGSDVNDIRRALSFARVIVVGDNDRNPETRAKMQHYTSQRAALLNGLVKYPPEKYKDIDEWLNSDPQAVNDIRNWK